MYKVNISSSSIKKSTAVLMNSNKLHGTINILSKGILIKTEDLELVTKTLERLEVKFSYKKVA
jgi:hypothetical protein